MRKNLIRTVLASAVLVGLSGVASAGGSAGSFGVGAEYTLLGIGGASVNFDQGDFHVGGFFGFSSNNAGVNGGQTRIDFGGRFFYHVHSTAMSDFGIGAQVGLRFDDDESPADDDFTGFYVDLGAQIRTFLSSNVALSATVGVGIAAADDDGEVLAGDVIGVGGIHYYFF